MLKVFVLISVLFLFASCETIINEGYDAFSQKYPTQTGHEWEYSTTWKYEFYDTTGHIDSTSTENLGNTIVKVTKEQDTVEIFTNLILFEHYDVATPQDIHKMWYENNASGLNAIAYYNPGASQWVVPKQSFSSFEQFRDMIKTIGTLPGTFIYNFPANPSLDSIHYYLPFRKVLMYPLTIGSRWIELTQPFYRERFINKQQIVNSNGREYNCYKVESYWTFLPTFEFTDYINLNSGLILREVIVDSMAIVSADSPDIEGYIKSTTISKLVREKK